MTEGRSTTAGAVDFTGLDGLILPGFRSSSALHRSSSSLRTADEAQTH